jgi:hypothetical protein
MTFGKISTLFGYAKLIPHLGFLNICRVINYRFFLRLGIHPVCHLNAKINSGIFFEKCTSHKNLKALSSWEDSLKYFDWYEVPVAPEDRPNWFLKPFSGGTDWPSGDDWWKPQSKNSGDIKEIWDLSRFNWLLAMAQRAANGDVFSLERLNNWLIDWVEKNPPYKGPNWACGQEASIRIMHMAVSAQILSQDRTGTPSLIEFLEAHLKRIDSTIGYAIAQDNNHGVLEAVGLFVGGVWLKAITNNPKAKMWEALGRKWMENRANRLISSDGGFSMYSITYHREFLDALAFAEYWRRKFDAPEFSKIFYKKTQLACLWLNNLTDPDSGDAPNIGGNDGTRLFPLSDLPYRDFRPSVQFASIMFFNKSAYRDGVWNDGIRWLDVLPPNEIMQKPKSHLFDCSGFALLVSDDRKSKAVLRYPKYKFRPSKCDALHLDFWRNGENLFRGSGSFVYDQNDPLYEYFSGAESHNTVQFDKRDQMRRLSKFLFADWTRVGCIDKIMEVGESKEFYVSYKDSFGAKHKRCVALSDKKMTVTDSLSNFKRKSVLRWRLQEGEWEIIQHENFSAILKSKKARLTVKSNVPIVRCELVCGYESLFYMKKNLVDVLEIEINESGTFTTDLDW